MPSEGRRLHGFTVVSGSIGLARQLVLPAILGGASAGDSLGTTLQWVVLILTVPSILLAFARWLMFRYRLESDELVIDSGVPVSYTHLRAHETDSYLVCRLLLEQK